MDSFKSGSGAVTLVNSAGLVLAAYYFHGQTVQLRGEVAALTRQIADLRLRLDRVERETKKEFKHLRRELAAPQVEDMSVAPPAAAPPVPAPAPRLGAWPVQRAEAGSHPTCCRGGACLPRLPAAAPAGAAPALRGAKCAPKARPVPPADADLDALSADL